MKLFLSHRGCQDSGRRGSYRSKTGVIGDVTTQRLSYKDDGNL